MITPGEHLSRILAAAQPLPAQRLPLTQARGLVTAREVTSRWPIPLFDNSAMDGYAVRRADAVPGARLRLVADLPAGTDADPHLGPGEAARIMTGAPVPGDADAIVPLEQTELGTTVEAGMPKSITVLTAPAPGAHIRRQGEDAPAGTVTVPAGIELGPWQLSSVASAGHDQLWVHRSPRVAVISTGSELVPPAATPRRGQIPESNSVLLSAALAGAGAGADVVDVSWVPDDEAALRAHLATLAVDAVILSGGASVGAFDVVKAVLSSLGILFDRVAMQPGKPQGFGVLPDGTLAFCLPGNPVAVAVSFEMFVRPALRALAGHTQVERPRVTRTASVGWGCPPHRMQVLPAVIDETFVRPATSGGSGSHLVSSLAKAHALALIPAETERVHEGETITVMVLS
ncbi:gephyrin-like molybdotransferase Glp [Psychromicrobium xiongbiense]|uniref:molybdopterin molybdotransferase MoeA n=1 Tax=Psychromicrobium xiongbiense TaxID=3051184 RepID=UPI00255262E8|nr:gephyrin-like molybdotransferase Glp [Psychromicrobium sp. YIM S02556]